MKFPEINRKSMLFVTVENVTENDHIGDISVWY